MRKMIFNLVAVIGRSNEKMDHLTQLKGVLSLNSFNTLKPNKHTVIRDECDPSHRRAAALCRICNTITIILY